MRIFFYQILCGVGMSSSLQKKNFNSYYLLLYFYNYRIHKKRTTKWLKEEYVPLGMSEFEIKVLTIHCIDKEENS